MAVEKRLESVVGTSRAASRPPLGIVRGDGWGVPRHLWNDEDATRTFLEVRSALEDAGLLDGADPEIVATFAASASIAHRAYLEMELDGLILARGERMFRHPAWTIWNGAVVRMLAYHDALGLPEVYRRAAEARKARQGGG